MKGKNERDGGTQKKRAGEECSSEPPPHDPLGPLYIEEGIGYNIH